MTLRKRWPDCPIVIGEDEVEKLLDRARTYRPCSAASWLVLRPTNASRMGIRFTRRRLRARKCDDSRSLRGARGVRHSESVPERRLRRRRDFPGIDRATDFPDGDLRSWPRESRRSCSPTRRYGVAFGARACRRWGRKSDASAKNGAPIPLTGSYDVGRPKSRSSISLLAKRIRRSNSTWNSLDFAVHDAASLLDDFEPAHDASWFPRPWRRRRQRHR